MATEARVMTYARDHGYPVPVVHEISGDETELVMDRVDGPSMLTVLQSRPWSVKKHATMLADLHKELHKIPAPDWIKDAPCGTGSQLLHLDLHPDNIMIGPSGPVVIDWSNAARGDENVDVALTWILLAAGGVPKGRVEAILTGFVRSRLVRTFHKNIEVGQARAQLPSVVEWKLKDPHMGPTEQNAMRDLILGLK
jgi:aminoglycoside phosphotransferase (APT) family kinase protein